MVWRSRRRCSRWKPPISRAPSPHRGRSPPRRDGTPKTGSEGSGLTGTGRLASRRLHVSRDIAYGLDAAKLVRVDHDLVTIAENRDQLDHINRVPDKLSHRRSEGSLTLLDREGFAKGLEEVVVHVTSSR